MNYEQKKKLRRRFPWLFDGTLGWVTIGLLCVGFLVFVPVIMFLGFLGIL